MTMRANNATEGDAAPHADSVKNVKILENCAGMIEQWWRKSGAERWGVSQERFGAELARCVGARFRDTAATISSEELESYVGGLALEDVGLACGCADGAEAAWEHFVGMYRGYLRACAAKMMKRAANSPEARELADGLFAELYGVSEGKRGALLKYFHGRSTLRTWLRAVLAQRHVDSIRAGRRFTELVEEEGGTKHEVKIVGDTRRGEIADPHRERYGEMFARALKMAMATLGSEEARMLKMYYVGEKKLGAMGRQLGMHESSVSRNLEKARRELRRKVEEILRGETRDAPARRAHGEGVRGGLSEAEMELCFQFAAEDAPIDLDKLFLRDDLAGVEEEGEKGGGSERKEIS
jgi:RNA polymerase sigma factor (sigma-70 family)